MAELHKYQAGTLRLLTNMPPCCAALRAALSPGRSLRPHREFTASRIRRWLLRARFKRHLGAGRHLPRHLEVATTALQPRGKCKPDVTACSLAPVSYGPELMVVCWAQPASTSPSRQQ